MRFEADVAQFICECADPSCTTRVESTLDAYEHVREAGDTFLLAPGHSDGRVETVVEHEPKHDVVRKVDPLVRPLVVALDPRGA